MDDPVPECIGGLLASLFGVAVLCAAAGCAALGRSTGGPDARPMDRAAGVCLSAVRLVPPREGDCVGAIEVTVRNDGARAALVGGLDAVTPEEIGTRSLPSCDPHGPWFDALDLPDAAQSLEPGATRVLVQRIVRRRCDNEQPWRVRGEVWVRTDGGEESVTLTTSLAEVDDFAWPRAERWSSQRFERELAEGRGVRVFYRDVAIPVGGESSIEIAPDGRAHGAGCDVGGAIPSGSREFAAAGVLSSSQREALLAAIRAAPLAEFRPDPLASAVMDGRVVHLVVTAGPAAFVASAQWSEFRRLGLGALCERLCELQRELPEAGGER
jgi:hypothetical protein